MQELELMEMPTVPATFRQLGVLVLDGSGSMTLPVDSMPGQTTKADAVNLAVRELMTRMKASRTGLNLCRGANLPVGSHHSAAMAENLATSTGSMDAESAIPFRGLSGNLTPSM